MPRIEVLIVGWSAEPKATPAVRMLAVPSACAALAEQARIGRRDAVHAKSLQRFDARTLVHGPGVQ